MRKFAHKKDSQKKKKEKKQENWKIILKDENQHTLRVRKEETKYHFP